MFKAFVSSILLAVWLACGLASCAPIQPVPSLTTASSLAPIPVHDTQNPGSLGSKPGMLYFLNSPETVKTPGALAKSVLPSGTNVRIFFHFLNSTGKAQRFSLHTDSALIGLKSAWCVDAEPGKAGAVAAKQFLALSPATECKAILVDVHVENGMVISGIVEGRTVDQAHLACQMGAGELVPNAQVEVVPHLENSTFFAAEGANLYSLRIGQNQAGHIAGDYGTIYKVRVTNHSDHLMLALISVSPRGGSLRLAYLLNGESRQTGHLEAYGNYLLSAVWLAPGKSLDYATIPEGGYSYPIELRVVTSFAVK